MDKHQILKEFFGHDAFRPGQERLIDALLDGRDALGIMPTGGGKSLCYQIPALLFPGVTLVISPLISLMKDQVMALRDAGINAALINSSLSAEEFSSTCRRIRSGADKLIYVAPERLAGAGFVDLMRSLDLSLIAVDEAHCISQWGQDFRPSYLKIVEFLEKLPRRPVVSAFTATATAEVRQDIVRILQLQHPLQVVTGFDRPNLFFDILRPSNKMRTLQEILQRQRDKSGIVYCATRSAVEQVQEKLAWAGFPATRYHAGLDTAERQRNQDDFQYDRKTVMVATNAFGMGIDKSNVSFVVHYHMPKSLEAYYQEAGRAGRDGEPAECILLFSPHDIVTAKFLIQNGNENEALSQEEQQRIMELNLERLDKMIGYCKTTHCLRGYILDYFGQSHEPTCHDCGNCRGTIAVQDITTQAQMILSCVKRVRDHLGYAVGAMLIASTLSGSKTQRVIDLGLNTLTTYGLMHQLSVPQIREYISFLEDQGYLHTNPEHMTLELTRTSSAVLFKGERIEMPTRLIPITTKKQRRGAVPVSASDVPQDLLDALKALRSRIAQEEGVPAYIVFSNATLADMAARQPRNLDAFLDVSGVGKRKAARYGKAFLDAISTFSQEQAADK